MTKVPFGISAVCSSVHKQSFVKKVLIISPHFAPINMPDMHRVRLALPYLRDHGWEPVVLALDPDMIEGGVRDPLLEQTYPHDIRVVRVRGIPARYTRWAGIGSLWFRCGRPFCAEAVKLLKTEKFDLIFFSTTQFDSFKLGPVWKKRFGVPYVVDYQDPWFNDYYQRTGTRPPGGWLRFTFAQMRARWSEPKVLRDASGILSVSPAYAPMLEHHYPSFDASRIKVIPFGAANRDIELARSYKPKASLIPFGDGCIHHVYAGRCGPDMSISITSIFRAFKEFQISHPAEAARIHFHFIGTDYAPPPLGREWAMPIARSEGITEQVHEHCYRVPYFDALYYLVNAEALIAVGSNDPTYSASKIFPYILANRPTLVVFNENSPVLSFAKQAGCGVTFDFKDSGDISGLANRIHDSWYANGEMNQVHSASEEAFAPYTAVAMTRQLALMFEEATQE
jgi:hypothetical protein